jgi:general secretion pathway protein C
MALDQLLRKRFALAVLPLVALAALLNAQAVSQLVGVALIPDEKDLTRPPPAARHVPASTATTHPPSADPILARNPFDHVTGPLHPAPTAEGTGDGASSGPIDTSDIWNVPVCDGVDVNTIVASEDEDWSLASLSAGDGKDHLRRRGDEIGGKKIHFIGWDRVWLESSGSLCQAKLFDAKKAAAAPVVSATPVPVPSSSASTLNRRTKPVDADIKKGIQKVSETEFNVDRGTLDKILENQADLMRQARVRPVQDNGRTVGISMNGIRDDSLLGVLGMKNGDQLRTINGFDMTSPEKALEAYARLRTADKLTVQINRGGKDMNLDYNIR